MDIAGFVGFAASGPIDVPVPVEDATQFAAIFGADAPLAWDAEHGEQAYAYLGPAVRAFFRNGGRRCWVVRVADGGREGGRVPAAGDRVGRRRAASSQPAVLRGPLRGELGRRPARLGLARADAGPAADPLARAPVVRRARRVERRPRRRRSRPDLVPGERAGRCSSPWSRSRRRSPRRRQATPAGGPDALLQAVTVKGERGVVGAADDADAGRHGHLTISARTASMHTAAASSRRGAGRRGAHPHLARNGRARARRSRSRSLEPPHVRSPPPQPGALVRGVFASRTVWIDVTDVDVAPTAERRRRHAVPGHEDRAAHPPSQAPDALAERLNLRLAVTDAAGASIALSGSACAGASALRRLAADRRRPLRRPVVAARRRNRSPPTPRSRASRSRARARAAALPAARRDDPSRLRAPGDPAAPG